MGSKGSKQSNSSPKRIVFKTELSEAEKIDQLQIEKDDYFDCLEGRSVCSSYLGNHRKLPIALLSLEF